MYVGVDKLSRRGLLLAVAAAVILFAQPLRLSAQWVLLDSKTESQVREGLDAMYNLRYEAADTIFTGITKTNPGHPAGYFLLALTDWWRIVPNTDDEVRAKRLEKSFYSRIEKTLAVCEQRLDSNPNDIVGLFFKGAALGYQAREKVLMASGISAVVDYGSAALDAKTAFDILMKCQSMAPSNSDILLGSGLFNYLSVAIPETMPSIKPVISFVPTGDKEIGRQMLRISGQRAVYANIEAKYSLLDLLSTFEQKNFPSQQEALKIAQDLHAKYPANPIFYRYLAKSYYMTNDWVDADSTYADILRKIHAREYGYEITLARQSLYYLGIIRLHQGQFDDAVNALTETIKQSNRLQDGESSWAIMANLRLGNALDMLGRRDDAVRFYKRVLDMDNYADSRAQATKYIATAYKQ